MKTNKKRKGFTLVELIAVIAILGVLAAILVPNITKMTEKSKIAKVKADAKIVLNIIQTAKAQATDDTKITCYTDAVTADSTLIPSKEPNDLMKAATVDKLQAIIDGTKIGAVDYSTWAVLKDFYN